MHQDRQLQLAQEHPHLAVALLLMDEDTDVDTSNYESGELSVMIQQTDIQTGVMTPLKVVF